MKRLGLILLFLALAAPALYAAPRNVEFVVDSTADEIDASAGDGLCKTASGTCTMRAAVMQANYIAGNDIDIILPAGEYLLTRSGLTRTVWITAISTSIIRCPAAQ